MIGVIKGTGSYVPEKAIDNNDLAMIMETNDEWIRKRTGIARRHIAIEDTTVTMAVKAAERALENAGVSALEIELILVSTVSSNVLLPSTACEVQKALGAVNATCFDINAACTGFLMALNTAQAYIYAGMVKNALIIGAECLSNIVNWEDRGTAILFGDGAGAAVVTAAEGEFPKLIMHSDGSKGDALMCQNRFLKANPWAESLIDLAEGFPADTYVQMDGQEVFKFAVRQVSQCIEELLSECGKKQEEIDYFILHQANERIVEGVARRLKADIERFPMNLMEYGNTSSASIPILLDELNRKGALKKGMKIILSGFGAGLSWCAAYMEWQ